MGKIVRRSKNRMKYSTIFERDFLENKTIRSVNRNLMIYCLTLRNFIHKYSTGVLTDIIVSLNLDVE